MSLPSLNAMHAFVTVAQLGSVTAAAHALFVTPSAVSRQIRALERDLGQPLFSQDGRGVRLTSIGEHLQQGLDPAFAQIRKTVERLQRSSDRETIIVRVPPIFALAWLMPRLSAFRHLAAPGTNVIIHDILTAKISPDIALTIDWGRFQDDPNAEKLADVEFFPVCSEQVAGNFNLARATLLHHERLPKGWGWAGWPTFLKAVGIDGIDATAGPRFSQTLIFEAARKGLGVAITDTVLAHDDLNEGRLVRPIAESMASDNSYWLLIPPLLRGRPDVMAFRAWLQDEIATCFDPGRKGLPGPGARGGGVARSDLDPPPPPGADIDPPGALTDREVAVAAGDGT